MVNVPSCVSEAISTVKNFGEPVCLGLFLTFVTSCKVSNNIDHLQDGEYKLENTLNLKNVEYALVDPEHSIIYPCDEVSKLPDDNASYYGYCYSVPLDNNSILKIDGKQPVFWGYEKINPKKIDPNKKIVTIPINPITCRLSFNIEEHSNIKIENIRILTPNSVYLVNLEPVGANGKIDISGNKDVNVLANRTLPIFILVTINDVQYLLKLNLTETKAGNDYVISLVHENGEPVAYLESSCGTRAEPQKLKIEQEVIENRKHFGKDDVRTDSTYNYIGNGGDGMINTESLEYSCNSDLAQGEISKAA